MASIYYRGRPPAGCWWLQFYHPATGELMRFTLATGDRFAAELIRQRVELECELLKPQIALVTLPLEIWENLGLNPLSGQDGSLLVPVGAPQSGAAATPSAPECGAVSAPRTTIVDAMACYIRHIRGDNAESHVPKKMSMLRLMFGSEALEKAGGDRGPLCEPGSPGAIHILKRVNAVRQIEIAELMVSTNNYAKGYVEVLFLGTPKDQLANPEEPKKMRGMSREEIAKMEYEMETLENDFKAIEESYGQNVLHLTLARGYVKKLLENARIVRFLSSQHAEIFGEFEALAAVESL